ncbi:unnamed protein product [Sphagnum troendelagicum]|uniref:Uncharacterized protein n=1 Tax=Sphagnum jensenii TaxID=128206 RepID=A0ABP0WKY1_9BRYO
MSAATTTDNTTERESKTEKTKRSGRCTGASAASGKNKASHDSEGRNCILPTQKCPMNDGISVILNGGIVYHELRMSYECEQQQAKLN